MAQSAKTRREAVALYGRGFTTRAAADQLGVGHASVARWVLEDQRNCRGCRAQLREPSPDGLCGFCQAEKNFAPGARPVGGTRQPEPGVIR
jgi:hypothetical protein